MHQPTNLRSALRQAGITASSDVHTGIVSAVYFCTCTHSCICRLPHGHHHCSCTQQDVLIRQIGDQTSHHVCEVLIDLNRVTSIYASGAAQECPHQDQHQPK